MRKCWLPAFSPFLTMFSQGFIVKVVKNGKCVRKAFKPITNSLDFLNPGEKGLRKHCGKKRKC